jgi:hypothetical protein
MEATTVDRNDILAQNSLRHVARARLKSDIEKAKADLHPKAITNRWKQKQIAKVDDAKAHARELVKKNALSIAVVGIGALLFAVRGPILKAIEGRKSKARSCEADKEYDHE